MQSTNIRVIFSNNGDIHVQDGEHQFSYSTNNADHAAQDALAIINGIDTSDWVRAEPCIDPTTEELRVNAYRAWDADDVIKAWNRVTGGWDNVEKFRAAICAVQGVNPDTGLKLLSIPGTIILSNDPADYGDTATEEDIEVYRKYITDHAPHADVIMGASYEAGYDPDDSDDYLEQEEGDEWLESMWARYPEHEAKYR